MSKLTREKIKVWRMMANQPGTDYGKLLDVRHHIGELCDLALSAHSWKLRHDNILELREKAERSLAPSQEAVRDEVLGILLWCPNCGEQHVDAPDEEKGWTNPPHRTHECQFCGHLWRPSDQPTSGVLTITTKGKADGNPRPRYFATAADFDAALKRGPNAAAGMMFNTYGPLRRHSSLPRSTSPAPAAPDVASMVKRLRKLYVDKAGYVECRWDLLAEAAALLAKLGQRIKTNKESEHPSNYEFPPEPGASDE